MIRYKGGAFGFKILLRIHGSALFKATLPALISTGIFAGLVFGVDEKVYEDEFVFTNPYAIGVLMVAFTFLLTFKASFSYNRYWEACTAVHIMQSNWVDVGIELAAFHLQSKAYDKIRPPAFGSHPEIKSILLERDRRDEMTPGQMIHHLNQVIVPEKSLFRRIFNRKAVKPSTQVVPKSINAPKEKKLSHQLLPPAFQSSSPSTPPVPPKRGIQSISSCAVLTGGMLVDEPSLFLQEASHLLSLLGAVSFSTLRNDLECAASPLVEYIPGSPWPPVDPDDCDAQGANIRREYYHASRAGVILRYLCGHPRSEKNRCLYNTARPFKVLGGVSDAEIELLQSARGPLAKVALCTMWIKEFISREYMAGSTGAVAPPIISRLFALLSAGMSGYNQARKVAFIPFPFPHNQITSFFVIVVMLLIPILMASLTSNEIFGCFMTFLTVLGFAGLHEVARELEDPFRNVPNDIPLNHLQSKFNEALIMMFAGYHPNAWWEIEGKVKIPDVIRKVSSLEPVEESEEDGKSTDESKGSAGVEE